MVRAEFQSHTHDRPDTRSTRNWGKGFCWVENLYPDPYPSVPYPLPPGVYPTRDNPYERRPIALGHFTVRTEDGTMGGPTLLSFHCMGSFLSFFLSRSQRAWSSFPPCGASMCVRTLPCRGQGIGHIAGLTPLNRCCRQMTRFPIKERATVWPGEGASGKPTRH